MTDKSDEEKKAAEIAKADKDRLAELKAEHGQVAEVEINGAKYHFRQPSLPEYQRCMDGMTKDKGAGIPSLKELLYACCIGADVEGAIVALPAAITPIGNAILEMGGSEVQVTISKG